MTNEIAIKLVRDACSKQSDDGKFVLYEKDIELIAQGFNYIVRLETLEEVEGYFHSYDNEAAVAAIRRLK